MVLDNFAIETICHLNYVNENSQKIAREHKHAIVGISPHNGYYKEERIYQILEWVSCYFDNFTLFLGEGMSYHNFIACGYSEKEAKKKTAAQDRLLLNRVMRCIEKLQCENWDILTEKKLFENKYYLEYIKQSKELYAQTPALQDILISFVPFLKCADRQIIYPEKALEYFFLEFPFLLDTPKILSVPSSCFIYNQIPGFVDYIFNVAKWNQENQGFVALKFS